MRARISSRLTFANVVSVLALVVALGGGAYAALTLPKNSVGTRQLREGAVISAKVKDHSLLAEDFKAGQLRAGPPGQQGDAGAPGRDGAAVAVRVRSTGAVDTPADHSKASVPLASTTWTQAANEVDFGPFGRVTYTAPDSSSCGGTGNVGLDVTIDIDGKTFSIAEVDTLRDGGTRTATLDASHYLFEPDSPVVHTVTAEVSSVCVSGAFPAPFHVSDLRLDLIRAS